MRSLRVSHVRISGIVHGLDRRSSGSELKGQMLRLSRSLGRFPSDILIEALTTTFPDNYDMWGKVNDGRMEVRRALCSLLLAGQRGERDSHDDITDGHYSTVQSVPSNAQITRGQSGLDAEWFRDMFHNNYAGSKTNDND
ncbi:hypothetical protein CBL_05479 [Carabus blaptoides fortunei]